MSRTPARNSQWSPASSTRSGVARAPPQRRAGL
jgi:hypothetical protein